MAWWYASEDDLSRSCEQILKRRGETSENAGHIQKPDRS
jgi:hypothetical protein